MEELAQAHWLNAFRALDRSLPRLRPTDVDVVQLRARLDVEAAAILHVLSAVNERRNELALPSMLPPEVLTHIFSCLVVLDPVRLTKTYHQSSPKTLGWLCITHVCRRWRNICIDQPSLVWSRLSPDGSHPWEVFLERARGCPLIISGALTIDPFATERVRSMLQRQHQVQELSLAYIYPRDVEHIVEGLTGPLPYLQTLQLSSSANPVRDDPFPSLHWRLLSDAAPQLRHLGLEGVGYPWGCGSPNLTHFHYASSTDLLHMRTKSHSFADVVSSLQSMPALTSLKLLDALPNYPSNFHPHEILLLHLEELHISSRDDSCWRLWSQLNHPRLLSIQISGAHSVGTGPIITSRLREHLRASLAPRYQSLDMIFRRDLTFRLFNVKPLDNPEDVPHSNGYQRPFPSVTLNIQCEDVESMAKQLIAQVPLEHMCTIDVLDKVRCSQSFYEAFLPARSVTDHYLRDKAGFGIFALIPIPSEGGASTDPGDFRTSTERVLFPSLRDLSCISIDFSEGSLITTYAALREALVCRSESGKALQQLTVEACDVSADWIESWEKYVDELHWDGEEGREGVIESYAGSQESDDEEV
ncbi:hypothetical protein PENSPDRAFT_752674 [Peniophora sp. CONT]|nr:hypothetical protein PENSPDRAFT_752674 [Peniophora sp. CONT]